MERVELELSEEVLAFFRGMSEGLGEDVWRQRINETLKDYVRAGGIWKSEKEKENE